MFEDTTTFVWTGIICLVATGLSLHQVRALGPPSPRNVNARKKAPANDFFRDPTRRSPPPTIPPAAFHLLLPRNRS